MDEAGTTMIDLIISGACSMFQAGQDAAINPKPGPHYVACRWDYVDLAGKLGITKDQVKSRLAEAEVYVVNEKTSIYCRAQVADWGPADWTGRAADLSPEIMRLLDLETDDEVTVRVKLPSRRKGRQETYTIEWWPFPNEAQYVQHHAGLDEALRVIEKVTPAQLRRDRDGAIWSTLHQAFLPIPKPRKTRRLTPRERTHAD